MSTTNRATVQSPAETHYSFGAWVSARRHMLRLTQREVADQVGCSLALIRKIEIDERRPSVQIAERLARSLHVAPHDIAAFVRTARGEQPVDQLAPPERGVTGSAALPLAALRRHANGNLPVATSSFVGRRREIAELHLLLRRADLRLLTLTGAGGSGKTRLAVEAVRTGATAYPDGIWFVDLAPVAEPAQVLLAIMQTLGVAEDAHVPPRTSLLTWLQQRQILLLIDNFEHLLSAAPLLSDLLRAAEQLRVLVTSRVTLRLQGEHEYLVEPLALPPAPARPVAHVGEGSAAEREDLAHYDAVQLFLARAQERRADPSTLAASLGTIAEICAMLEGMPLAIELAAARTPVLSPTALLAGLQQAALPLLTHGARDLPARQRTLRATIEWSYQLLEEPQQRLLAQLSVFAGGWTLDVAAAVAGEDGLDVVDGLQALVEHSLVQVRSAEGATRYTMLETLREYGLERLSAWGVLTATRERHARAFSSLVAREEPALWGPRQPELLDRFDADLENLRAAAMWLLAHGALDDAALLAVALRDYWVIRCRFLDGVQLLEAILAQRDALAPAVCAKVLLALGNVYREIEQFKRGREHALASLEISRALGDQRGIAAAGAAYGLGLVWPSPDPTILVPVLEEALAAARAVDDARSEADALLWYGWMEATRGEHARARPMVSQGLALHQRCGSPHGVTWGLAMMQVVERETGNYPEAYRLRLESLHYQQLVRSPRGVAIVHENLRELADLMHDHERGIVHSQEQLVVSLAAGLTVPAIRAYAALANNSILIGRVEAALAYAEAGLALARATCANAEELSRSEMLVAYAEVLLAVGRLDDAEALIREALTIDRLLGESRMIASDLDTLGEIMLARRLFAEARAIYTEAITIVERIGLFAWAANLHRMLGLVALRSGDAGAGAAYLSEALQRVGPITAPLRQAAYASAFAELAVARGHPAHAPQLWAFADSVHASTTTQMWPVWRTHREQLITDVRAAIGGDTFEAAWRAGIELSWEHVLAAASAWLPLPSEE